MQADWRVVVLAGGVGGAKLADGLAQILSPEQLTIIVNTGDDFTHFGLQICPDLDTVMYTLGGVANSKTGWGLAGETWQTMGEVASLGGSTWFNLGDKDLATHLTRTELLYRGEHLTAVTQHLCQHLNIAHPILPMSNQPAPTMIESGETVYGFQEWFVREKWQPAVTQVMLPEDVRATVPVMTALETADLVIIAPSNPFVSIDPILNTYPIRTMIEDLPRAVLAVSPIIGGNAVKGPAAKLMKEFDLPVSAKGVHAYYGDLLDGFVYDQVDEGQLAGEAVLCTDTIMRTQADRIRLAQEVLAFAQSLVFSLA